MRKNPSINHPISSSISTSNPELGRCLWRHGTEFTQYPCVSSDFSCDVLIIGGGLTGLWTAYYLKQAEPSLRISVVEARYFGFGASGRNGGWLLGGLAKETTFLTALEPTQRHQSKTILHGIINEVERVCQVGNIDCHLQKQGVLYCAARYPEQAERLQAFLAAQYQSGFDHSDFCGLDAAKAAEHIRMHNLSYAVFSPHCATIHPVKLLHGLLRCLEDMGVQLFENSPVQNFAPHIAKIGDYHVKAEWIVPALEAYGKTLSSTSLKLARYQLPVQSLIIASQPLPADTWQTIGLKRGQAFSDFGHLITYGQRTADDRLLFGARGSYLFAGKLRQNFLLKTNEIEYIVNLLIQLFPSLKSIINPRDPSTIPFAWGGNLAVARGFAPHMLIDKSQGYALAGGYQGEGVGATNLAGRTLADLLLGKDSELVKQPWVYHDGIKSLRTWESEPIPFLGYSLLNQTFNISDYLLTRQSPKWLRKASLGIANYLDNHFH